MKRKEGRELTRKKLKNEVAQKRARKKIIEKILLWAGITIVIIIGLLIALWILAEKELTFEEVMKEPKLREDYIGQMVQKIGKPVFVSSVMYADTQEELEFLKQYHGGVIPNPEQQPMVTYAYDHDPSAKEPVQPGIAIFTSAFNDKTFHNEDDFVSGLTHEYRHAEVINLRRFDLIDFRKFISPAGNPNEALKEDVAELDAIRKEFQANFNISERYRSHQKNIYLVHYTNIWKDGRDMPPDFINGLKVQFFEPWMWEFPDFFREKRNGKDVWYFKNPKTSATYYFSDEEIKLLKEKFGKN